MFIMKQKYTKLKTKTPERFIVVVLRHSIWLTLDLQHFVLLQFVVHWSQSTSKVSSWRLISQCVVDCLQSHHALRYHILYHWITVTRTPFNGNFKSEDGLFGCPIDFLSPSVPKKTSKMIAAASFFRLDVLPVPLPTADKRRDWTTRLTHSLSVRQQWSWYFRFIQDVSTSGGRT